jgi:hypothetical protein
MATKGEIRLIEKIVRAKVKIESMKRGHSHGCPAEDDTGYGAPSCSCGADEINAKANSALKDLSFND